MKTINFAFTTLDSCLAAVNHEKSRHFAVVALETGQHNQKVSE
jgi:hypothetical protein